MGEVAVTDAVIRAMWGDSQMLGLFGLAAGATETALRDRFQEGEHNWAQLWTPDGQKRLPVVLIGVGGAPSQRNPAVQRTQFTLWFVCASKVGAAPVNPARQVKAMAERARVLFHGKSLLGGDALCRQVHGAEWPTNAVGTAAYKLWFELPEAIGW